jgi:hypothetical protein
VRTSQQAFAAKGKTDVQPEPEGPLADTGPDRKRAQTIRPILHVIQHSQNRPRWSAYKMRQPGVSWKRESQENVRYVKRQSQPNSIFKLIYTAAPGLPHGSRWQEAAKNPDRASPTNC